MKTSTLDELLADPTFIREIEAVLERWPRLRRARPRELKGLLMSLAMHSRATISHLTWGVKVLSKPAARLSISQGQVAATLVALANRGHRNSKTVTTLAKFYKGEMAGGKK